MESIISPLLKYKCFAFLRQHTLSSDIFQEDLKKIKLEIFPKKVLPKITTSKLQPSDAGIIKTLNINIESC